MIYSKGNRKKSINFPVPVILSFIGNKDLLFSPFLFSKGIAETDNFANFAKYITVNQLVGLY